jgi:hypothetical protein
MKSSSRASATVALLLCLTSSAYGAEVLLCFADNGLFPPSTSCARRHIFDESVEPSPVARKFLAIHRGGHWVSVGTIPAGATEIDTAKTSGVFALNDEIAGPEGASGEVVLTETKLGVWRFPLEAWWFQKGRLNIYVPKGTWHLIITAGGKELQKPVTLTFSKDRGRRVPSRPGTPPGRISLTGRATSARGMPDFAQITADCRSVVCDAAADGSFRCDIARPRSGSICIEHPRFGRRRIELEPGRTSYTLGAVELLTGATVRVVRPLHVELPSGTTVSLRHQRSEAAAPKPIDTPESVEFAGLAPGKYEVLLAGPDPLQRKLFPVTIGGNAEIEVVLSVAAWRLTGEVQYRDKALPNATISLTGEAWDAELTADQSGRFDAELWSAGDYAVVVRGAALAQPYGEMKRASASDHHWRFDIPSRRIAGRVTDATTGSAVTNATLYIESKIGETRWSRAVPAAADGTFEIPGIGAGEYTITPRAAGFLPGERVTLHVAKSDGDRTLTFALDRGTLVSVVVMDTNGELVADALLASDFTPDGLKLKRLLRTDAEGRATVPVREKTTKTLYVLPRDGSIAIVTIAGGGEGPIRIVMPDAVASLSLHARTKDGEPLPRVGYELRYDGQPLPHVVLQVLASVRPFPLATDGTGQAVLEKLPAGRYEIVWRPPSTFQVRRTAVIAAVGVTQLTETF